MPEQENPSSPVPEQPTQTPESSKKITVDDLLDEIFGDEFDARDQAEKNHKLVDAYQLLEKEIAKLIMRDLRGALTPEEEKRKTALSGMAAILKDKIDSIHIDQQDAASSQTPEATAEVANPTEKQVLELRMLIANVKRQTEFTLDAQGNNELFNQFEQPILKILDALEVAKLPAAELDPLKEEAIEALYRAYRRTLIKQLEYIEDKNTTVQWTSVLEQNMVNRMLNLVERLTGQSLESMADYEKRIKQSGAVNATVQNATQNATESAPTNHKEYKDDFENLRDEYTARKFLHISWQHVSPVALGANRDYIAVSPDDCPIVYMADYLIRSGLKSSEFGQKTNEIIDQDRRSTIRPYSSASHYDQDGKPIISSSHGSELQYNATVFGETLRVLDRWSRGLVTLKLGAGGEPITTSNIHTSQDELVDALFERFRREEEGRENVTETRFSKNEIRRAFRLWVTMTYHESARAVTSAKGADNIYYRHQFAKYNAGYVEATKFEWEPVLTEMLFTFIDPDTNKKINPLPYIFGDSPEQRAVGGFFRRGGSKPALEKIKEALESRRNQGFVDPDKNNPIVRKKIEDRLGKHGFESYEFLLSPLITCINVANGKMWREEWDGNKLNRYFVKLKFNDETSEWDEIRDVSADEADDDVETFTLNPALAYVFLRDETTGRSMRFDTEAGPATGRPVSFLDLRDEMGNIVYEALPFKEVAPTLLEAVNSLSANGGTFLKDFLKNPEFRTVMETASKVGWFKNQGNYILRHLPNWGSYIAAGVHKEDPEWKYVETAMMSMLVCMLVYCKILLDVGKKKDQKFVAAAETSDYLTKLIERGAGIDQDNADAIQTAAIKAQEMPLRFEALGNKLFARLKERFRYSEHK